MHFLLRTHTQQLCSRFSLSSLSFSLFCHLPPSPLPPPDCMSSFSSSSPQHVCLRWAGEHASPLYTHNIPFCVAGRQACLRLPSPPPLCYVAAKFSVATYSLVVCVGRHLGFQCYVCLQSYLPSSIPAAFHYFHVHGKRQVVWAGGGKMAVAEREGGRGGRLFFSPWTGFSLCICFVHNLFSLTFLYHHTPLHKTPKMRSILHGHWFCMWDANMCLPTKHLPACCKYFVNHKVGGGGGCSYACSLSLLLSP